MLEQHNRSHGRTAHSASHRTHVGAPPTTPSPTDFAVWVRRAIADLGMYKSNFLLDPNVPSSRNRVSYMLDNPHLMKLEWVSRLEREILNAAAEKGVELLPLLPASSDGGN